ncbi:MAG: hypothetical protein WC777_03365 [Candidatus Gracilibacteria bacterium]|jgi:hypothetical protein
MAESCASSNEETPQDIAHEIWSNPQRGDVFTGKNHLGTRGTVVILGRKNDIVVYALTVNGPVINASLSEFQEKYPSSEMGAPLRNITGSLVTDLDYLL